MLDKNAPIIVGVGQTVEAVPEDLINSSSHADLAAAAVRKAVDDALGESLLARIDTIVGVRTFMDSGLELGRQFGKPNNMPRAISSRLGITPEYAVYENVGGQSPQKLVGEFSAKLNNGDHSLVLITGSEAIASIKVALKAKITLDWAESSDEQVENRGLNGGYRLITGSELQHKVLSAMQLYSLMEQARRADLGLDNDAYNQQIAERFSEFSKVAESNPYSMFPKSFTAEELLRVSDKNPMMQPPYTRNLVAKDSVNMGAALLVTTVGKAQELGISQDKWVFVHGYADTKEKVLLERPNLGKSPAMAKSLTGCLAASGKSANGIGFFDIYSCFPIVVEEASSILGVAGDDPRPLTLTGGLPYFGGPGNNYSMHGIASMVETLRANPGKFGMVYANGGWMSKHSAGIYSTQAPEGKWQASDSSSIQAELDQLPSCELALHPQGEAILDSYTINYQRGKPVNSVVIGRLKDSKKRFYAINAFKDTDTLAATMAGNKIGHTIYVATHPRGNRYAYSIEQLTKFIEPPVTTFQDSYEHCLVERKERVLIVTINREASRNALSPQCNQELENIFNAFEADKGLWVAIITGAGDAAFSAGNDLKYQAKGGDVWFPKSGFGGLTSRKNRTKPVIAALNGLAVGGGLEVALACDMIVAADHAIVGLPEVKVGMFAGAGGIQRLTRMIGMKKAVEMIITGELIDAKTALDLGLVNYVVPGEDVVSKALELANKVASVSPTAVSASLQMLHESSSYSNIDDAVTFENHVVDALLNCGDFIEGPTAFVEKRKPRWEEV